MSSEYERKLIEMQYQMRENNAHLGDYISDLNSWTEDIKKKESSLKESTTSSTKDLPPVRNFVEPPRPKKKSKKKTSTEKPAAAAAASTIRAYDYRSWDKFDVDGECERIDKNDKNDDGDDEQENDAEEEEDDEQWQEEVLKQKAEHFKKWGNHHYEKKSYNEAIECYTKAIECNPTVAAYFANRAQCQLFEQRYGACEADCSLAIQLDKNFLKAFYRRALARIYLGKTEPARQDLEHILSREPTNKDARTKLDELNKNDEIKRLGRIYPLRDKPLDQRSKKPLKRIEIQEIDTSIISGGETTKKKSLVIEEIESAPTPVETPAPVAPPPVKTAPSQPVKSLVTDKPAPKPAFAPPSIPTTGYQFKRDWSNLNQQVEQQAAYFERIPPSSYKTLFSAGLDSSVFSRILLLWSKKTVVDEQLIDSMFELRRTPRFDTQLSFLDGEDQQLLKTTLQRLQTECSSSEKISTLVKAYQIN